MAMGLLTKTSTPPDWHPAPQKLKDFCKVIANECQVTYFDRNGNIEIDSWRCSWFIPKTKGLDFGRLAAAHAASHPEIATHLVGMQNRQLLKDNMDVFVEGLTEEEEKTQEEIKQK